SSLGLSRHAWLRKYCFGFFAGIIMFSAVFAVLAAAGLVKEDLGSGNQPAAASIPPVLIVLAGWIVQGPGEEILCRGWMMPVLSARYRVSAGVLLSSLVFAIYHSLNPSFSTVAFLNIFLVGIFLSLFTLAEGSIWGVFGWHTAWNWAQGDIFGLPVSGLGSGGGSILHFQVHGPALLTGSGFGPEGGMAVTGILVGGIALMLWFLQRKTSQNPR
ncbi:MAG TPA: CPBP family intramembrane glutamic endopeptidase, partial [Anaerolineaceae bacterium]